MSHFTVTVRVPADVDNVEGYVDEALRPYYEQGSPDDDFMEFQDCSEEIKEEWENKTIEQVVLKDGTKHYQHSQKFREVVAKHYKLDYASPNDLSKYIHEFAELKDFPASEVYSSIEKYANDYHGYRKHEGVFGYWHNPNAKWDWWQIGGRWSGLWRHKNGTDVNILRISDLDMEHIKREASTAVDKFLSEYRKLFDTGEDDHKGNPFHGPRATALDVGLIDCLNEDEITDEMRQTCRLIKWERQLVDGVDRYDVLKPLPTGEEANELLLFLQNHFNNARTYARLDEKDGWVEPGEMGWWGMSSATSDSRKEYSADFTKWLKSGHQDDTIVVVDCRRGLPAPRARSRNRKRRVAPTLSPATRSKE